MSDKRHDPDLLVGGCFMLLFAWTIGVLVGLVVGSLL